MMTNDPNSHSTQRSEAEARSRKAAQRATEGAQAMADYVADGHAVRAKTARLKELRLAKEAAEKEDKSPAKGNKRRAHPESRH
jgi:hypothetical protein